MSHLPQRAGLCALCSASPRPHFLAHFAHMAGPSPASQNFKIRRLLRILLKLHIIQTKFAFKLVQNFSTYWNSRPSKKISADARAKRAERAKVEFGSVINLHEQLIILQDHMAISEFEQHRLESLLKKFCDEKGPPAHIRDQLQWGFRIDPEQQTVELFEIRPYFMDASRKIESKFAKAAYVKTAKTWKVYWMRGTGNWTKYDPCEKVKTIEKFLTVVKEDEFHCFIG